MVILTFFIGMHLIKHESIRVLGHIRSTCVYQFDQIRFVFTLFGEEMWLPYTFA